MTLTLHDQIPDPGLIEFIEDVLEQAKNGSLVAVGVAAYYLGAHAGTGMYCSKEDEAGLLGEVTILQSRLADSINERRHKQGRG